MGETTGRAAWCRRCHALFGVDFGGVGSEAHHAATCREPARWEPYERVLQRCVLQNLRAACRDHPLGDVLHWLRFRQSRLFRDVAEEARESVARRIEAGAGVLDAFDAELALLEGT